MSDIIKKVRRQLNKETNKALKALKKEELRGLYESDLNCRMEVPLNTPVIFIKSADGRVGWIKQSDMNKWVGSIGE